MSKHMPRKTSLKTTLRSGTSFLLTFDAILLLISGIILYLMPQGRIAHWNLFTIWSLQKEQWEALHVAMAILFLMAFPVHLFLNWKIFLKYLKEKYVPLVSMMVLVVACIYGSSAELPPFSWVMDLSDRAKAGWNAERPPAPHFELKTIHQIVEAEGQPLEEVRKRLTGIGIINLDPNDSLQIIGKRSGVSPAHIYKAIKD